jgi:hypothetical protein
VVRREMKGHLYGFGLEEPKKGAVGSLRLMDSEAEAE